MIKISVLLFIVVIMQFYDIIDGTGKGKLSYASIFVDWSRMWYSLQLAFVDWTLYLFLCTINYLLMATEYVT
jgi:hypothetical protein